MPVPQNVMTYYGFISQSLISVMIPHSRYWYMIFVNSLSNGILMDNNIVYSINATTIMFLCNVSKEQSNEPALSLLLPASTKVVPLCMFVILELARSMINDMFQ